MPTIAIHVTPEVDAALRRQASALLLGRAAYVRAVLAAIAEQARCEPGSRDGLILPEAASAGAED